MAGNMREKRTDSARMSKGGSKKKKTKNKGGENKREALVDCQIGRGSQRKTLAQTRGVKGIHPKKRVNLTWKKKKKANGLKKSRTYDTRAQE